MAALSVDDYGSRVESIPIVHRSRRRSHKPSSQWGGVQLRSGTVRAVRRSYSHSLTRRSLLAMGTDTKGPLFLCPYLPFADAVSDRTNTARQRQAGDAGGDRYMVYCRELLAGERGRYRRSQRAL